MKNKILDYKQVLAKLNYIEKSSNKIKREKPIGYTTYGLPILYYTAGSGKNHIVLGASQHGCEIITTNFLLELMGNIAANNNEFKFLEDNEYTLHFLPMLNPEGYLISTSAIRKSVEKGMLDKDAQEIYKEYVEAYAKDDKDSKLKLHTKIKAHQRYFGHINPYIILNKKFKYIQDSLVKIYKENGVPEGTLVTWSSNGNGVDLNQNMPYNPKVQSIIDGETKYALGRYDNIETTKPGPIGCPMRGKEFQYEPENQALLNFLLGLKHKSGINLCAFFNYHSTGGILFYKPYSKGNEISSNQIMDHLELEEIYNKKIAEAYSRNTKYELVEKESALNCFNDLLRLQIPGNILVELSAITGNPLAPFIDKTHDKTINDNLKAVAYTLQKLPEFNKIKKEFIRKMRRKELDGEQR